MTFDQLEDRATTARYYRDFRRKHPSIPALSIYQYLQEAPYCSLPQYVCHHDWAINEESDRAYCLYCGLDGDA